MSRHAAYHRHALSFGRRVAHVTRALDEGTTEGFDEIQASWPHIERAFQWASAASAEDEETGRLCLEYLHHCAPILFLRHRLDQLIFWSERSLEVAILLQDPFEQAYCLWHLGRAERFSGETDRAVQRYEQARALLGGGDDARTLLALINQSLGIIRSNQQRDGEAEALLCEALSLSSSGFGADHMNTAMIAADLAEFYLARERVQDADRYLREATPALLRLAPSHPNRAFGLALSARLKTASGEFEEARRLFADALEIFDQVFGARHPDTIRHTQSLANVHRVLGEHALALQTLKGLLAALRSGPPLRRDELVPILRDISDTSVALGAHEEAYESADEAFALDEEALGPQHPETRASLSRLAWLAQRDMGSPPNTGVRMLTLRTRRGPRFVMVRNGRSSAGGAGDGKLRDRCR